MTEAQLPVARTWWTTLLTVGSPVALGSALLFYFGWARSSVQADRLGYDISIVGFSTADYVVRSINLVFVPAIVLVLVALGLQPLHERVVRRWEHASDERRCEAVAVVRRASWLWGVLGVIALGAGPRILRMVAIPVGLTLAVLTRRYAATLARRWLVDAGPRPIHIVVLGWLLLGILIFWDTERLALLVGEGYATATKAEPARLVAVTVFSTKDLDLDAPGIVEQTQPGADSAYGFRYDGLRLVQQKGERYILINERWDDDRGRVFLLTESAQLRLEFHRTRTP